MKNQALIILVVVPIVVITPNMQGLMLNFLDSRVRN
jgi:hypothetical protein